MGWPMPEINLTIGQIVAIIIVSNVFGCVIGGLTLWWFFRSWCNSVHVLDGVWVKTPRE